MIARAAIAAAILVGCTASEPPTPESGPYRRLVLDDMALPTSFVLADSLGIDLNGDGNVDNALGTALRTLFAQGDVRDDSSVRGLIGSGAVPSLIDVFGSGDLVGVAFHGTPTSDATVLRGTVDGAGGIDAELQETSLTLLLPALVDADPSPVQLDYAALELSPTGDGGYDVGLQGLAEDKPLKNAACVGLIQMIENDPEDHQEVLMLLDTNQDGKTSLAECVASSVVATLLYPDVMGPDDQPYFSIGLGMHVVTPPSVPPAEPRSP